jgi:hypothetical protein
MEGLEVGFGRREGWGNRGWEGVWACFRDLEILT